MFALDETIEWDKALFSFMHRRCGSNYGHNSKKLMEAHRATMWPTRMFRLHLYCLGHYRTWAGQRQLQQAQAISIDRTTKTDTIQIVLCSMIDQGLAMPTPVQHQFNTISTPVRILLLWSTFDRRWFINRLVKMHAWRILHCHLCCRLVLST